MLKQVVIVAGMLAAGAALAQTPAPTNTQAPSGRPTQGAVPAPNTTTATTAPTAPANLSPADKKFIDRIASANEAEIKAAQLAEDKASSQKVKDLAQTMLTDHTDAGQKLTALAQQKGLTVPTDLEPADQKQIDRYSKLSGKKFDRAYVKTQISDHEKVLALLKTESSDGQDPDVKALADQLTPTIQKHLDMLEGKS
jgi:putative membrane protein